MYFLETLQVRAPCHGVMILMERCLNFLNIEIILFYFIFFQYFMFQAISNIKKKNWCKKKNSGGGVDFFFRKTILSHFTFYAIFNIKKILKSAPSLTG